MKKVIAVGALILLTLIIAYVATNSVTLMFVATIVATILIVCVAIYAAMSGRSKKFVVIMASALVVLTIATFAEIKASERAELVSAKEQIVAAYEPELSVDNIQAYHNEFCYAYAVLQEPKVTASVSSLEWVSENKPEQRYDVSDDEVFVSHVKAAISYSHYSGALVAIAVIAFATQAVVLKYI